MQLNIRVYNNISHTSEWINNTLWGISQAFKGLFQHLKWEHDLVQTVLEMFIHSKIVEILYR